MSNNDVRIDVDMCTHLHFKAYTKQLYDRPLSSCNPNTYEQFKSSIGINAI